MFDLTTYVKKWRIRQLKTVFSTLDTLWHTLPTLVYSCTLLHIHVVHTAHLHTIAHSCNYVVPNASAHLHKLDATQYKLKLTKQQHKTASEEA